jgi:hypothetical protein
MATKQVLLSSGRDDEAGVVILEEASNEGGGCNKSVASHPDVKVEDDGDDGTQKAKSAKLASSASYVTCLLYKSMSFRRFKRTANPPSSSSKPLVAVVVGSSANRSNCTDRTLGNGRKLDDDNDDALRVAFAAPLLLAAPDDDDVRTMPDDSSKSSSSKANENKAKRSTIEEWKNIVANNGLPVPPSHEDTT